MQSTDVVVLLLGTFEFGPQALNDLAVVFDSALGKNAVWVCILLVRVCIGTSNKSACYYTL